MRAKHECALHDQNCFLTLTYDDLNLPSHLLMKDPLQRFLKRLRKRIKKKIKYMVAHEYGSNTARPHHHIIIFGFDFPDQKFLKTTPKGYSLYTSPLLTELWSHGHSSIGEANAKTANYIAKYNLKGSGHTVTDPNTGELVEVRDTANYSQGIGLKFFTKNFRQIFTVEKILPRYYIDKIKNMDEYVAKPRKWFPDWMNLDFQKNAINYLQTWEDSIQFKNRTHYEIYAKAKNEEAADALTKSEFRSRDTHKKERELRYLSMLKDSMIEESQIIRKENYAN